MQNSLEFQITELDRLGHLLAQIADLEAQAEVIKNVFKSAGKGSYEGSLFKATVSAPTERVSIDYKQIVEDLALSENDLKPYKKTFKVSSSIRLFAR
jgi:hypothetical protein